ncbi:hypothetical protein HYW87_02450 [Candidatus Roizmanbacteria bacterium]|nr:hypothetical protein [Candidatus Roizmanbacteria bacterium]
MQDSQPTEPTPTTQVKKTVSAEELMRKGFSVSIYTLESVTYQGRARIVSSINEKGPFDVLPLHANFISIIKDKIMIREAEGGKKEFPIKSGVMKVYQDSIFIFLGVEGLG